MYEAVRRQTGTAVPGKLCGHDDAGADGKLKIHDDVRITTDAEEMETLYKKSIGMQDSDEKLDILTRAYMLYRGRLFKQGEMDVDSWLIPHTMRYSQIYVDVSTELLNMLGRRRGGSRPPASHIRFCGTTGIRK